MLLFNPKQNLFDIESCPNFAQCKYVGHAELLSAECRRFSISKLETENSPAFAGTGFGVTIWRITFLIRTLLYIADFGFVITEWNTVVSFKKQEVRSLKLEVRENLCS